MRNVVVLAVSIATLTGCGVLSPADEDGTTLTHQPMSKEPEEPTPMRAASSDERPATPPSCTPAEKIVTSACSDPQMIGKVTSKTEHVCDDSRYPAGKDVMTQTDDCRYPCEERQWTYDTACGPADVQERIWITMKHVCDGSNLGKGQDVEVKKDISGCQGHSPLVLDLDGDGLTVIDLAASRARFDLLNDGHPVHTAWIGAREAFLVLDRNGDGFVNDRSELFGDMRGATNGFEDLARLDDDASGAIDARDAAFADLRLWIDADGDGYSRASELFTLADKGVSSISVRPDHLGKATFMSGQWVSDRATFTTTSGAVRNVYDVWFKSDR